ncbi:MAG: uroporphyrinogen decarboxylase family protein [Christensenellales bacterium]
MFTPDYHNILNAAENRQAERVPLYEHNISDVIMERLLDRKFAHLHTSDLDAYFKEYDGFFEKFGYDTVTFEACVTEVLPHGGALAHPQPGYIDCVEKFETYPWDNILDLYVERFRPELDAMARNIPAGMKAIGGVGNGVFEIAEDLVGYENLCIMSFEEPELYARLFVKIGDLLCEIWKWFLDRYKDAYCVCRFGDDLGYKSNTMLSHDDIRTHIIPQYKRIVDLVHSYDRPFLLHSCGCIFDVMEDIISVAKIDAKHSNEDQISPFAFWVDTYGDRIGNFGGIDTDHLVRMDNAELEKLVVSTLEYCAKGHGGFAIGSGNSIPAYVDPEKYLVMINTVRKWRGDF